MNQGDLIFIVVAIIAVVAIYNLFFNKAAIVKRKLRTTPGKKLSTFKDNEVGKVIGEIKHLGKTLRAPLSDRKCVYYHVHVEQRRSNGKSSSWYDLIEEEEAGEVIIKDGRHYALIKTELVKSHLVQDANYSSGFLDDATPSLEKYLKKHGYESTGLLGFNKTLRYNEGVLEEGELLAVVGKGVWKTAKELKLKLPVEKILVIGSENEEPVYLSDDPSTTYDLYESTNTDPGS